MAATAAQRQILEHLAEQIGQIGEVRAAGELFSSGYPPLDGLLPGGGFRRGWLVEWVAAVPGVGATELALAAARSACGEGRLLVAVDRRREFYPPAAASLGLAWEQMVIVQPANAADEAWAIDQALRSPGVGAVLAWPQKLDDHTFRRWQLAAETSGAVGLLLRPAAARRQPSWAQVKLLGRNAARGPMRNAECGRRNRWKIEILRMVESLCQPQ
jgi:hypothetical protein